MKKEKMTRVEAKDRLAYVIRECGGCKTTDLFRSGEILEIVQAEHNLPELIEELVQERRVVEVEYWLPNIPYRIKSFLLPEGSCVARKEILYG